MTTQTDHKALRGALIGCGFFARNQMQAWAGIPGVDIVALCDHQWANVEHFMRDFGVKQGYASVDELFAACNIDFVDIVAPTEAHAGLVQTAARNNVDIICQKPFAGTLPTARDLISLCRDSGVSLTIHENFRWQGAIRRVAMMLHEGVIGTPFFGRISYRSGYDVFANQPYLAQLPRFIIQDLGIHLLDVARALFGDVIHLSCETARVDPDIAGEDAATMMLRHDQGTTCVVDCSYATHLAKDPFPQSLIEIDGNRGSIRLKQDFQLELHDCKGNRTCLDVTPDWPSWSDAPWSVIQESVVNLQRDWVSCMRHDQKVATSGEDNFNTLALVEAAYESADKSRTVVPERWQD